jgi:hypothetical protein
MIDDASECDCDWGSVIGILFISCVSFNGENLGDSF